MKILKIGDLTLGEGMPEICIPLTGTSEEEILKEAEFVRELPCQIVEWRADYMLKELQDDDPQRQGEKLKQVLGYLRLALDLPIIFTIRTQKEGGQAEISREDYFFINTWIAESRMADVIDIEVFEAPGQVDERRIHRFLAIAQEQETKVLLSSHDFEQTPDLEEILARFFLMQDLGADLMKLAVMPQSEKDSIHRHLHGRTGRHNTNLRRRIRLCHHLCSRKGRISSGTDGCRNTAGISRAILLMQVYFSFTV